MKNIYNLFFVICAYKIERLFFDFWFQHDIFIGIFYFILWRYTLVGCLVKICIKLLFRLRCIIHLELEVIIRNFQIQK